MLAAVDAATDSRAALGVGDPWAQIRLYTAGQPRVGDAGYAALLESLIGERFRIVNSGDPVPHLPPNAGESGSASVLTLVLRGLSAATMLAPKWLRPLLPDLAGVTAAGPPPHLPQQHH